MGVIVNEFQKDPEIVIFAGPNGSGKSTFTQLLKPPYEKEELKLSKVKVAICIK